MQTTCWDDPKFGDRVLARAAAMERKRILGPMAAVKSKKSAKVQLDELVTELMEKETDGDKARAMQIVKQRYPGVLQRLKIEANR